MHDAAPGPSAGSRTIQAELDRVIAALRGSAMNIGGLLLMLALIAGLFAFLMPGAFARATTLQAMMFQLPELGLLSLAMAVPLISGGINLAIVATANLASLLTAWVLTAQMPPDAAGGTLALWLAGALAAGLALCIVVGLITGLLVAVMEVHPILVTLGTMTLLHGLSIYYTRGRTLSGFPDALLIISNRTIVGLPISFVLFVIVAIVTHVLLTRTPLGIRIHMIGSNLEATRYSGVDTRRTLVLVYLISSLLCWLASVVMMARFNSAGADIAQSYLLITVLAAILGGIDPYGGFGRIVGLFIALCILQMIASGFNLMNLSPQLGLACWGLILLGVMLVKRVTASLSRWWQAR